MSKFPRSSFDAHILAHGLTDVAISKVVGVKVGTVRLWRRGLHKPHPAHALILVRELGIPLEAITDQPPDPKTGLDEHMRVNRISNRELAARMAVSVEAVRMWRAGTRQFSIARAKQLASVLNVPLAVVLNVSRHALRPPDPDARIRRRRNTIARPQEPAAQDCAA